MISSITDPAVVIGAAGLLACNPAMLALMGAASVADIGERGMALVRDMAIVEVGSGRELSSREAMRDLARATHQGPWILELRRADLGVRATYRATMAPLTLPAHPGAILIALADITELEAAVTEARHEAALLALADDAILSIDANDIITQWLGGAERIYGWTAREAIGRNVVDLLRPEPPEVVDAARTALHATGTFSTRVSVETKSGHRIVVSTRQTLERDPAGRFFAVLFVDREIRQEALAREEAERLAAGVIEASPMGVVVLEADGAITHANDAMVQLLGVSNANDVIGRLNSLTDPLRPGADLRQAFARAFSGEIVRIQRVSNQPGGAANRWPTRPDSRLLDVTAWPIRDPQDDVPAIVVLCTDSTDRMLEEQERRKVDERIRRAQKLEGLAVLAGGVAHDLNNILAPIMGNAAVLEEQFAPGSEGRETATAIREAGDRGAALARQMLAYAGGASIEATTFDLRSALEAMRPLIAASLPKGIETVMDLDDVGAVTFDPTQLQQVILNLAINAAEAIGETGVLTIRTQRRAGRAMDAIDDTPSERVIIEVEDTGSGMSPETCERLFEPFYSTKGAGRGLGLAAVLGIVRAHEGTISACSRPGAGTTLLITLPPARAEDVRAGPAAARTQGSAGRPATVLVVDDEPAIRRLARLVLERDGHTVLEARDGASAIDVFAANRARICAVLCDLTLPYNSGREVIRAIHALDPTVPVVVMSGWSQDTGPKTEDVHVVGWLQKPFTPADLRDRVAEAIATPGSDLRAVR